MSINKKTTNVGLDNIKQDMSLTYIFVISRIYVYLNNNEKATPNETPDPKPIEIPIAILSRATPKVIATPTPMLIP